MLFQDDGVDRDILKCITKQVFRKTLLLFTTSYQIPGKHSRHQTKNHSLHHKKCTPTPVADAVTLSLSNPSFCSISYICFDHFSFCKNLLPTIFFLFLDSQYWLFPRLKNISGSFPKSAAPLKLLQFQPLNERTTVTR